jgi:hypothetical protein
VLTNEYGFEVVEYSNPITGVVLYGGKPSPPVESESAVFGADWWFPPGLTTPFVPPPTQGTCCSLELPDNGTPDIPDAPVPEPSYFAMLAIVLVTFRIFHAFTRRPA